jgi:hypothetical protein
VWFSPWSYLSSGLSWLFSRRAGQAERESVDWGTRSGVYAINELLYAGTVYATRHRGGALEDILKLYVGSAYIDVNRYKVWPHFMPFREIVDTYLNVLPGTFGQDITVAPQVDDEPVNPLLADPLSRIWRASNLDTEKQMFIRWCANFGTVGLRVSLRPQAQDEFAPRPVVSVDHPSRLFNFEEDANGNVTAVVLKYGKAVNRNAGMKGLVEPQWETDEVVEVLTKDEFSLKVNDRETLAGDERRNLLGFCPYVLARHRDNGTPFGDWAYKGSEEVVHRINWRISRQDTSIDRHQFPKWFGAAAGKAPTSTIKMGDTDLTYIQTIENSPPPVLKAIVADVNQLDSRVFWMELRDMVRGNQPELNLNDVKMLAGVSGETLAQILKPTEQAILSVRPAYDHALIRALQMALSAGVVSGAWDLGTGIGTTTASDNAYRQGLENFAFQDRPALPLTTFQKQQQATANTSDKTAKFALISAAQKAGLDTQTALEQGLSAEDVATVMQRKATQDTIPTVPV